ncbi:MAG: hypothetical protein AB7Q37_17955 [Pyrinomonadaceae bacterium]
MKLCFTVASNPSVEATPPAAEPLSSLSSPSGKAKPFRKYGGEAAFDRLSTTGTSPLLQSPKATNTKAQEAANQR